MNPSELFIRRPVTTTLVMLGIVIFGVMAYRLLPVSDLPNVDFPTIQVSASLPGASPETMAAAVALPLEKQFATIAGVTSISSSSSQGSTSITLQFDLSRDIDAAAQDVQSMIAKAGRQLPPQMPTPPSYQKVNPADQPIIFLVLRSQAFPLSTVDEYAETTIAQRISMVTGVAQVGVYGAQKYAVRIDTDPRELAARSIGLNEVAQAVSSANANVPAGTLYGPDRTFVVQANGQLFRAQSYGQVIVAYRNGRPVRLAEVARVYNGVENDKTASWYGGQRSIYLAIQKQPGTNTVAVVDAVKALLPQFRAQLPAAVQLDVRTDRSVSIRASVNDVKFTLMLTVCLVVTVIFLFLRTFWATIIPSLALPTSIIATFAVMYLLGYSLDNLSLMALTLSVGFVVDDAIVMLENIVRHTEMGEGVFPAALGGSEEVVFTILSMTLSLTAVFIPVLFMGGLIGRLLHEFAVTIAVAILVSGFVSVSLTPMLCSRFLKSSREAHHGRLYRWSERVFEGGLNAYSRSLRACLNRRVLTFAVSIVLLAASVRLFMIIPKGFLPSEDTGRINVQVEAMQGIGYPEMVRHQQQVAAIVADDPNVSGFTSSIGGMTGANAGRVNIDLKPRAERALSADQVIEELRPKLARVAGVRVYLTNPPPINIGGMRTRSLYQFTLQDTDTAELYRTAPVLEEKIRQLPGLEDVSSDLQIKSPQVQVDLDRDRIAALGLSVDTVENTLYNAYGTRQISTIYAPNNQYQVILGVMPAYQLDPNALSLLYVRASNGPLVPLNTVARVTTGVGPLTVNHVGQLPSVTISFNLKPGVSLGDAVAAVQAAASDLPATIATTFQGAAQAFQDSMQGLGLVLLLAIVVIYIVLGILYESFIHPLTILSGLPSAGLGALATLILFRVDLNLYAFVGVIMLVGLVMKNAIMMTTMAALVGTAPIALGWGAGAESRRPLGLAVVGGLLVSQTLTLYLTPVYYVYLERLRLRFSKRAAAAQTYEAAPGTLHS